MNVGANDLRPQFGRDNLDGSKWKEGKEEGT